MGADSDELRLVNEYRLMHGLAMQLFDSLKYLPHYGDHLWRPSFQRAFELFAKLWKYQQDHRAVLADEAHYGLTRWEIGVIAAKIGQLYYFYYLRTGDVGYLNESYVFYDAVRARRYFHDEHGGPSDTAAKLAVRLRYTTRFAVVCVLVGRRALHAELNDELTELVRQYATHAPPDLGEWQRVLADMRAVREQYDAVRVLGVPAASSPGARGAGISSPLALDDGIALSDGAPGGLSAGVAPGSGCAGGLPPGACGSQPPCAAGTAASSPPAMAAADGAGMALGGLLADTPCVATRPAPCSLPHASAQTHHHLGGIASAAGAGAELREALLVGTDPQQATLGELTIDVLRMLRALELPATAGSHRSPKRGAASAIDGGAALDGGGGAARAPHKLLLHRPSCSRLLGALAAACSQAAAGGGAVLLYLSAQRGADLRSAPGGRAAQPTLQLTPRPTLGRTHSEAQLASLPAPADGLLCAADLLPFQRGPLLVVADGHGCGAFELALSPFGSAVAILRSGADELGLHAAAAGAAAQASQPAAGGGADGAAARTAGRHTPGRILTHFLTDPVLAFCQLARRRTVRADVLEEARARTATALTAAAIAFVELEARRADEASAWRLLLSDRTLCALVTRFLLCRAALKRFTVGAAAAPPTLPTASPPIPPDILDHPTLKLLVDELDTLTARGGGAAPLPADALSAPPTSYAAAASGAGTAASAGGMPPRRGAGAAPTAPPNAAGQRVESTSTEARTSAAAPVDAADSVPPPPPTSSASLPSTAAPASAAAAASADDRSSRQQRRQQQTTRKQQQQPSSSSSSQRQQQRQ